MTHVLDRYLARAARLKDLINRCPNCSGPFHTAGLNLCYLPVEGQMRNWTSLLADREYRSLILTMAKALRLAVEALLEVEGISKWPDPADAANDAVAKARRAMAAIDKVLLEKP